MAVAGLHIEISRGAGTAVTGGFDSEDLSRLGALGVEEALAGNSARRGGDDAAEIGMGRGAAGGRVGEVGGAADEGGMEPMGGRGRRRGRG